MKPSNDREAMTLILQGLTKQGHAVTGVIDDTWNKDDVTAVTDPTEAAELCDEVDEAFVLLTTKDGDEAWIYFVLGNDPEEVACNYTVNLDPDLSSITDPWWE